MGFVAGSGSSGYSIGDSAQGGIVFWVDETGQHGLACTKSDQSAGIQWYNGSYTDTEANGDGPLSGKMNTILIIANQGSNSINYAAGLCANLQITEGGKTYGDWYLPSKEELDMMYVNLHFQGLGGFTSIDYWSSTEFDNNSAWYQDFFDGFQNNFFKDFVSFVRAVRAF